MGYLVGATLLMCCCYRHQPVFINTAVLPITVRMYWYDTIIVALIRGTLLLLLLLQTAAGSIAFSAADGQGSSAFLLSSFAYTYINVLRKTLYAAVQAVYTLPAFNI